MARKRRTRAGWGTVRKRTSGRFTAQYTGPDGAVHSAGMSFPTETDARGWLAAEHKLIDLGTWTPPKARREQAEGQAETVGQWLDRFHDLLEHAAQHKASTMQNYRRVTRVRITDPYGPGANDPDVCSLREIRLADLTKADVYRWWDGVQQCYPDARTISLQAYKRLKAACAEAVRREMIPTNPVDVPHAGKKPTAKEKHLPTDGEIAALLAHVPEQYRVLTSLTLHHGLRIGEALALEVGDVTIHPAPVPYLPRVSVTVRQNAQRMTDGGGNYMLVQSAKTQAGHRTVPIMGADVPYFLAHLVKHAAQKDTTVRERMDGDSRERTRPARLLTVTARGNMVMDTSFRSVLNRAKVRAGVDPGVNPHTGRNWLITRLAEQGAHLKEIGALLGQKDMDTIMDVYMKVRAGRTDTLMEKVNATLEGGQ